jgi:hypothetical protein
LVRQQPINCTTHAATDAEQPISISPSFDAKKDLYSLDWTSAKALGGA